MRPCIYPGREAVERLRSQYPRGTRVRLARMDDPYRHPREGTAGTVLCVDDIGTIHIEWDDGSTLGAAYGEDIVRKL